MLKEQFEQKVNEAKSLDALNALRVEYLGKKGLIPGLMKQMKSLSPEEKKTFGARVNVLKDTAQKLLEEKKEELEAKALEEKLAKETIDITLPGRKAAHGNLNPLNLVIQELEDLFIGLGYQVIEGEEVVEDLYCFERANIPKDHPARDMQDSLYIDPEHLLRTHTTAIQMKVLEESAPNPIKVVCPGKTYRRDDDDATHSHQFTQMEGLVIGEHVPLSDLKGTLEFLARKMFGQEREIRFRPSYFPFTEPSVEVDVSCHMCGGKGCSTCKGTGWIEILGAGEVNPRVLEMAGYDPNTMNGFAFGVGIERIAMLKYGIDDIRHFYTNDKRFNEMFDRFD
jgi:phenylalanyl-tRNA synthetase alpha chain